MKYYDTQLGLSHRNPQSLNQADLTDRPSGGFGPGLSGPKKGDPSIYFLKNGKRDFLGLHHVYQRSFSGSQNYRASHKQSSNPSSRHATVPD